jgi:hypothetical protein
MGVDYKKMSNVKAQSSNESQNPNGLKEDLTLAPLTLI